MNRKKLMAISTSITLLTTLLVPLLFVQLAQAADPTDWYTTVDGVLSTDTYKLYPYEQYSVNVGFSKFGELIGIDPSLDQNDQANWVGLEYLGRDPFCPASVVPMSSWINGWYIDIQYTDPALTGAKKDRHLWAFAMFGDGFGWGGDWTWSQSPGSNPGYGRQTNGSCVTEPLKVLYDSPREFVAMSVTHISDKEGVATWAVVDVTITMIFNKVSKEVVLYKDVKLKIPKMHLWGKLDVQFSNREEYDLGPSPTYDSYAHFYDQVGVTDYDSDYHLATNLLRENIEYLVGDGSTKVFVLSPPGGAALASDFVKVWVNGVFQDPSTAYTINYSTKTITFTTAPADLADIEVHYKHVLKTPEEWDYEYDIAQVISSDGTYVAWTAMWPPVSDYTVDGILRYLEPLVQVNEADCDSEPKQSPLIIGEWDFLMDHTNIPQFRCVEVKGITTRHDAADNAHIDKEIMYRLDETFNPIDLNEAVHKETRRWIYKTTLLAEQQTFVLANAPMEYPLPTWDEYCTFSERVLVNGVLQVPERTGSFFYTYTLTVNSATGVGTITFRDTLEEGDNVKILYSTLPQWFDSGNMTFAAVELNTSTIDPMPTLSTMIFDEDTTPMDPLGLEMVFGFEVDVEVTMTQAANFSETITLDLDEINGDFKVLYDPNTISDAGGVTFCWENMTAVGENITVTLAPLGAFGWDITAAQEATVIDMLYTFLNLEIDAVAYEETEGATWFNVTITPTIDYMYWAHQEGQYEWMVVGKDASTIDSAGAAYITQALDSKKQIHVQMTGMDIRDTAYGLYAPYVMGVGSTGTRTDYYYSYPTDMRAALADDWCTTVPVASSNMLFSGGARANLGAEYFNDFTMAFYAMGEYVTDDIGHANKLMALSCWNKNTYASDDAYGYAAISVYKDINGTVGFLIWGIDGQDTYYAAKWFWDTGIYYLQQENYGVTDIILEIEYISPYPPGFPFYHEPTHPVVSIVERLGTISEKTPHDP